MEILNQKYCRAKNAAIYLGVGVSTIWLYAKQKKLHPKKISSRVTLFEIEELDALLKDVK